MLRLLIALVGMLSTRRPGAAWSRPARDQDEPEDEATWYLPPRPEPPPRSPRDFRTMPVRPERGRRRPRIPRKLTWAAILIMAGPIFPQAIPWGAPTPRGAALHPAGGNAHPPHARVG